MDIRSSLDGLKSLLGTNATAPATVQQPKSGATPGGSALGAFASEALGKALSEQGGFGIATGIVRQLSAAGNKPVTTEVTGSLHGNTVINSNK